MSSKSRVTLHLPSKTFLLGEYAALQGLPAIIANTKPQFKVSVDWSASGEPASIHPQSPAGLLLQKYPELKHVGVSVEDPWQGAGGFGASSAQYLAYEWMRQTQFVKQKFSALEARQTFLQLHRHLQQPPSGYDVLAQATGILTVIQGAECAAQPWPFADLSFFIVRTGAKIATHEHLEKLKPVSKPDVSAILKSALTSFLNADSDQFVICVKSFREWLAQHGYECDATTQMLAQLASQPGVLAVKGCGALGADTCLVICEKGCEIVGATISENDLCAGLIVEEGF